MQWIASSHMGGCLTHKPTVRCPTAAACPNQRRQRAMSRHLLGMALVDVVTQRQHTVHAVLDPRLGVPELIKRAIAFLAEHKAMAGGLYWM